MNENIKIMLSSTISDMAADRDAVMKVFSKYHFVEITGAKPIQQSYAINPYTNTLKFAEECDFYILLLGERYGYEIRQGTSATEAEFDRAVKINPTKVLVFKNTSVIPEPKQEIFIKKVGDYYKGYWISDYEFTHDLQDLVENSFLNLLKDRASIGKNLTYVDHFVRIASQRRPTQDTVVYYEVTKDGAELTYELHGKSHTVHFSRAEINRDFWGCLSKLDQQFNDWI
ncbi:DUF4062 domain-containing protein [Methylomicrobium sp. Wu6]|uniref:DUF4062 domain-containing protein n=1 Tax=Methylomicrobium sp. Wu6 TaxID=3107928 RepID=UPI002DD63D73|nr:DUF4062 domain-containing protein [Methylomicrobium sp. Wu6]MEC4748575.1 DUF4062 domain-containing protein [Methylomicrobium sp. Wu6]